MATAATTVDIRKYLFVLKRRAVLAASVFLLVMTVGLLYCLLWPPVYQAACLVLVQPQKVPSELVQAVVTTKIQERLQIITQQVLSRTRLMEVIERFNLYPQLRDKVAPDQLAQIMRKDVSISISKQNYFTIEFLYSDPQTVAAVANALAAFYVDSNLRLREEDAVGTARFLSREMERMRNQLQEWEGKITDFKEKHLHELPEAQEKNVAVLGQLQAHHTHLNQMVQAERTRINVQEQEQGVLDFREQQIKLRAATVAKATGKGLDSEKLATDESSPDIIRSELDRLRVFYTEDHPDVKRLKYQLAVALEKAEAKRKEREARLKAEGRDKELTESEVEMNSIRQSKERVAKRIVEGAERIKQFQAQQEEILREIDVTQKRIEAGPSVAEQLAELTRGYQALKQAYEKLQNKALDANLAANLERTQRGEQFEVVDPAQEPDSPYRPNVKKTIPAALALALALALGLALGLDFLDTSFTSVEQMERLGNFPVLVVVPALETQEEIRQRTRRTLFFAVTYGAYGLMLLGLTAILFTGRGPALKQLLMKIIHLGGA